MKKLSLALLLLVGSNSFALNEYYSLSKSLRAMGMGGAFYALSDDEYALFYNPAGLSVYAQDWQFMVPIAASLGTNAVSKFTTLKNTFEDSSDINSVVTSLEPLRGNPFSFGAGLFPYYAQKNFAVGLLIGDTKANFTLAGAGVDTEVRLTSMSDSGLFMGYAREVYPNLHIGATIKAVGRAGGKKTYGTLEIAQSSEFDFDLEELGGYGAGIDLDFGALYEIPVGLLPFTIGHRFSFTVNNLLATDFSIAQSGTPPQLPRYASVGMMTIFHKFGPIGNAKFLLDLAEFSLGGQSDPELGARTGSFWKHVNVGLEVPFYRMLALRTGFHQGNFTAGVGINAKYFKLDLAYYGVERGKSIGTNTEHRLAMRLAFGMGSFNPPAISESSLADSYKNKLELYQAEKFVSEDPSKLGEGEKGTGADLGKQLEEGTAQEATAPPQVNAPAETPAPAEEAPLDLTSPD